MSYGLDSLNGLSRGSHKGLLYYYRVIKGDARNLDNGSSDMST